MEVICKCCLQPTLTLVKNNRAKKGLYCNICDIAHRTGDTTHFEKAKQSRKDALTKRRLELDSFKCSMCKSNKPASEFIKNKGKKYGVSDRCKICDKIRHKEEFKRRPELRQYHRDFIKKRIETGETYKAFNAYYRRQSDSLGDMYIKICLKQSKNGKILGKDGWNEKLIEAKRIQISHKRLIKEQLK